MRSSIAKRMFFCLEFKTLFHQSCKMYIKIINNVVSNYLADKLLKTMPLWIASLKGFVIQ